MGATVLLCDVANRLQVERLEAKLRSVIAGRLRIALDNATGYALDDLGDGDGDEHVDDGSCASVGVPGGKVALSATLFVFVVLPYSRKEATP